MSSVRIQAGKGGVALPHHGGAGKRVEAAGGTDSFATALGVAAGPDGRTAADPLPAGAVLTAGGSGGTDAADADPALVADGATSGALAGADGAHQPTGIVAGGSGGTPATTSGMPLPALAVWSAPTGGSSTSGSRPHAPAGHAAADPGVVGAAIVIAAPPADSTATAPPPSPGTSGAAPHGDGTIAAGALPLRAGSGQAAAPATTATTAATADAGQPAAAATASPLSDPVASADPSVAAAPLAGSILTPVASPTEASRLEAGLPAPMPSPGISTFADAGAMGGYADRGSTSTGGRDREAARFAIGGNDATAAPATPAVLPGAAASGPAGLDPGRAGIADRLSDQVVRLLTNSGREAVVRLHPPELGEVMVRVAVSGRDVSAWFGSPQPLVQQAISQAIGQLHTDLGNAGYSLNGAWVGADASGSGGRGDAVPLPPALVGVSEIAPQGFAAARPAASGVSIYV